MTLPKDPYEITTVQLIEADETALKEWEGKRADADNQVRRLQERLAAYRLALQGYRKHRPQPSNNGAQNPYVDEAAIAKELAGLTNLQCLIKFAMMNKDYILYVNQAAHVMHRIGAIKGKWRFVPGRLYTLIGAHPEFFTRVNAGEYGLEPAAEQYMKDKRFPE